MDAREKHIFITEFLLSGRSVGELLANRQTEEAKAVVEYIHTGPPDNMAMTDPVMFARLRAAITKLLMAGW